MPVLLVSDTSVLIDLERGGLLEAIFGLPFEFAVPDLLYERELKDWNVLDLKAKGLQVLSLKSEAVELSQEYRRREPKLSLPDAFALALAKCEAHVLLAGDGSLRSLADAEGVEVHGVLWLLDRLKEHNVVNNRGLTTALSRIAAHPRCRLPTIEIKKRLEGYGDSD
jgi:predicted nucleic acid-binding protein